LIAYFLILGRLLAGIIPSIHSLVNSTSILHQVQKCAHPQAGYNSLQDERSFSVSARIGVAKAPRLIPSWIYQSVGFMRHLQNKFVHDLSLESSDKPDQSTLQSMPDRLAKFNPTAIRGEQFLNVEDYITSSAD
jgi:hypothetical protein